MNEEEAYYAAIMEVKSRFKGFGDDLKHGCDRWFEGERFMAHNILSLIDEVATSYKLNEKPGSDESSV